MIPKALITENSCIASIIKKYCEANLRLDLMIEVIGDPILVSMMEINLTL